MGNLELHPGIGTEVGYYSNPFYSNTPSGSAALRVAPHLFLSTLGPSRAELEENPQAHRGLVEFDGGLYGSYQHYFVFAARDALNGDLKFNLALAPGRIVGLKITQWFDQAALPFSSTNLPPAQLDREKAPDYTHYFENAGAQLVFQTPGGLLKGAVGYLFNYAWFKNFGFQVNDNFIHTATLNASWEFLPKTALFYDARFAHQNYPNADKVTLDTTAFTQLVTSNQVSSRIGLNGAITPRISATVAAGYAAGFFTNNYDYEGLIGSVEGRYMPSAASQIALVYERVFLPAYQGNYQERNRIEARFRWLFNGVFLLGLRGGVSFLRFGYDERQAKTRNDNRYYGELTGEYRFVDWLAATAQVNMLIDDTAFVFTPPPGTTAEPNPAKFTALEGWLGVRAFY